MIQKASAISSKIIGNIFKVISALSFMDGAEWQVKQEERILWNIFMSTMTTLAMFYGPRRQYLGSIVELPSWLNSTATSVVAMHVHTTMMTPWEFSTALCPASHAGRGRESSRELRQDLYNYMNSVRREAVYTS